ncbi:SDR family NAD(P)-dependent oxidoreductase [Planctomonas deserti]|uniref:SDR family NAD(P)-dependent oxidoreductase n=1 Tax=Planctomonas deserti TaxID=2144185 RepID=UPI000D3764BF|nr:SDR family oxidoreductase [Planctomonas deserti]
MIDAPSRPVTIVTGGSRGIGAAISLELAREGHDVVLNFASDEAAAVELAGRIEALGGRCLPVRADVTDEEQVEELFARAATLGPVTGLVNNAGATSFIGDLADTPVAVIRRVIELNLVGTVLCCRLAARTMSRSRGGRGGAIVNITSLAAATGSPHTYVHYAAAKAGVETLTRGLAVELGPEGVRVNAVSPGIVRTTIHADAGDAGRVDRAVPGIPLRRAGLPEDIAPTVAHALSERASYMSGAVITVSGGL